MAFKLPPDMPLPASHLADIVRNQSRHGQGEMFLEFACRAIEADKQPAPALTYGAEAGEAPVQRKAETGKDMMPQPDPAGSLLFIKSQTC
jgi:hypothetical protein